MRCLASSQARGAREESSHDLTPTLSCEEREPLLLLSRGCFARRCLPVLLGMADR